MTPDEFAQHIINALADYAELRSAKVIQYEVVKRNEPDAPTTYSYVPAAMIETGDGDVFHITVVKE